MRDKDKQSAFDGLPEGVMGVIYRVQKPLLGIEDNKSGTPIELTRLQIAMIARAFSQYGLTPDEVIVRLNKVFSRVLTSEVQGGHQTPFSKMEKD